MDAVFCLLLVASITPGNDLYPMPHFFRVQAIET